MHVRIAMTYGMAELTMPDDLSLRDLRKLERLVELARHCYDETEAKRLRVAADAEKA